MENKELHNPIEEARRYVANAEEIIKNLSFILAGYDTMHLVMGYDGNKTKKICDAGFETANDIINRCALLYNLEVVVA